MASWVGHVRRGGAQLPAVARRRSVTASHGRRFFADGLVDAVIALEALVGGGSSVRLQAAVAWLLEPDSLEARRQRYEEIKELYALRSGVVHTDQAVVGAQWAQAADVLREVLRRLLTTHRHLLADRDRSDLLLLGGGAPPPK